MSPNNSHDLFETGKSTLLSLDEFAELIVNFRAPWWRDNQDEVFNQKASDAETIKKVVYNKRPVDLGVSWLHVGCWKDKRQSQARENIARGSR